MNEWKEKIREILQKKLIRNIFWLYGVHFVNYLVPLITIPYLTRVLGVGGWGLFALIQSFALYIMTIVEYNFIFSATRDVAIARDDLNRRSELLTGVMSAKVILSVIGAIIGLIAQIFVPSLRDNPGTFWLGMLWMVTLGNNLLWYFQGLERMQLAASLDVSAKFIATIGIFFLVHDANDIGLVFLIYTAANLFSIIVSLVLAYREVPFTRPSRQLAQDILKSGGALFLSRLLVSIYSTANVFVVGLFALPQVAGIYAGADKLSKGFSAMQGPITFAIFPRLSNLFQSDYAKAKILFRKSAALIFAVGCVMSLMFYLLSPIYTKYYLGPGFEETLTVLRILVPVSIFIALNNVIVIQWMLPLGHDREYYIVTGTTAVIHLALAYPLITHFGAIGMAWAVLLSNMCDFTLYNIILLYKGCHPFQGKILASIGRKS